MAEGAGTSMTTWDQIRRALEPFKLKQVGREEWRSNIPWRTGSNSMGLSIKVILPSGEYGAWKDHVQNEGGSLYDLARRLGIEPPQRPAATPTKRGYATLAEYAEAHHCPAEAFEKAGWTQVIHKGRSALRFPVDNQPRYRFLDGEHPHFHWDTGSHPALYGFHRALDIARRMGRKPVYTNGAASVVVAQWFDIPAFTVEGGEKALAGNLAPLLDSMLAGWDGEFLFALDSDYTGQKAALDTIAEMQRRGRVGRNADLLLSESGDLCDFRSLWKDNSYAEIERRAVIPETVEPLPGIDEAARKAAQLEQAARAATADPAAVLENQVKQLAGQVERIQELIVPPRIRELHELAAEILDPQVARRWPSLPIPELAALVGPLEPELYVLLGATGMGKSWLAASIAAALTHSAGAGLVVTTETSPRNFMERMASYVSRVSGLRVKDGLASAQDRGSWLNAVERFKGYEGWVMDLSSPTPAQVEAAAKRAREKVGMAWILVDSASRMNGPDGVYERMTGIANALQNMARDFYVPVIVTSQIGRDVTDRAEGKKQPRLDDGYGSGAIEHNAGVVVGLYRREYYVQKELESPDDVDYPPNTARLILLKHRNRPVPDTPYCTVRYEGGCGFYPYQSRIINLNGDAD